MRYSGFVYACCLVTLALCQAGTAAPPSVYDLADQLLLLPTPRELTLEGGDQPLTGWEIVIPADAPLARTGAGEINRRIVELGGAALPVVTTPRASRPSSWGAGGTRKSAPSAVP